MNAATLEALKGSIKKWQAIVDRTGEDKSMEDCPLCQSCSSCRHCPVYAASNQTQCRGTPYEKWVKHQRNVHSLFHRKVHCPTCKKLAQAELDFLRSLLPADDPVVNCP